MQKTTGVDGAQLKDECYGRLDEFIRFARSDAHSAL